MSTLFVLLPKKIKSLLAIILGLGLLDANAQERPNFNPLLPGYYIVVAAYLPGQEGFALRYTEKVNLDGHHARVGFDSARKLIYVYLDSFPEFNSSIREMLKTRHSGKF